MSELKHYGVPGMKWGRRKAKPQVGQRSFRPNRSRKNIERRYNSQIKKATRDYNSATKYSQKNQSATKKGNTKAANFYNKKATQKLTKSAARIHNAAGQKYLETKIWTNKRDQKFSKKMNKILNS